MGDYEPWRYACPYCLSQNLQRRLSGSFYCHTNKHRVPENLVIDLRYEDMPDRTLEYKNGAVRPGRTDPERARPQRP